MQFFAYETNKCANFNRIVTGDEKICIHIRARARVIITLIGLNSSFL